jgi:3-oxoacyl-[acyl-carrier protein] reductase
MRKVVNITSIAGTDGNPGQAGYGSAKAGVIGLTKTMAKEWGRYNVNVNAVGFGLIETRLVAPTTPADASLHMRGTDIKIGVPTSALDTLKERCPLGRLGTPEEAAGAVLFFCSPLSDYVTGETLICGGGLHFYILTRVHQEACNERFDGMADSKYVGRNIVSATNSKVP